MAQHEVIVGNIGIVYHGKSSVYADYSYTKYVSYSKENYGRSAGENVTWLEDDEIVKEYIGTNDDNDRDDFSQDDLDILFVLTEKYGAKKVKETVDFCDEIITGKASLSPI